MLIVNADDFGYCPAVNKGVIESYQQGIVTSATIMVGMPGFDQAIELAKANPGMGLGVHLTLTCRKPIRNDVPSLVDEHGDFHKITFYEKDFSVDLDEVYQEWKAQINKVIASGIQPDHLDSHHHVHTIKGITQVFDQLAKEYQLPVRGNYSKSKGIKSPAYFFTNFDSVARTKDIWKPYDIHNLIENTNKFGSVEIMCHPGYLDTTIYEGSSLNINRMYTMRELQNKHYPKLLQENGVTLGTFKDL